MKGTWKENEKLNVLEESCGHSAVWVPSISKVMVSGGFNEKSKHKTVRLLDEHVATSPHRAPVSMIYNFSHVAKNGKVYMLGLLKKNGDKQVLCYISYDPNMNKWSKTYALDISSRVGFCAVSISDNVFLVFGGQDPKKKTICNDTYRMNIGNDGKIKCTPLCSNRNSARAYASAAYDGANRVWIFGGFTGKKNRSCNEMSVYNIISDTWKVIREDGAECWPSARVSSTLTSMRDPSKFLLYGGNAHHKKNNENRDGVFIFDSKNRTWKILKSSRSNSTRIKGHSATLLPNGSVMFYGGHDGSSWSSAVFILSLSDTNDDVKMKGAGVTTLLMKDVKTTIKQKRKSLHEHKNDDDDDDDDENSDPEEKVMSQSRPCKRARRADIKESTLKSEMKKLYEDTSKEMQKNWNISMQNILSAIKMAEEERKIAEFESDARRAELLRAEKLIQELSKEKFVFKERLMHAERRLKESQDREKELHSYHEKLDRALSTTSAMTETMKELGTLKASNLKVTLERDTEKRLKDKLIQENRELQVQVEKLKRKLKDQNRKFEKFVHDMKEEML